MGIFKKLRESVMNFSKKLEGLRHRECEKKLVAQHTKLYKSLWKDRIVANAINVGDKVHFFLLSSFFFFFFFFFC